MLNVDELFDPIEDPLVAAFADVGDRFAGVIIKADRQPDKYGSGEIPVVTLELDEPFEDGDGYVAIYARSRQLQKEIGRAARHCGRKAVTPGDWLAVEYTEARESASGNEYKLYRVEYRPGVYFLSLLADHRR